MWIGIDNTHSSEEFMSFDGFPLTFTNWKWCPENENNLTLIADADLNCSSLNTTNVNEIERHELKAAVISQNNDWGSNSQWLTDKMINLNDFVCMKEIQGE